MRKGWKLRINNAFFIEYTRTPCGNWIDSDFNIAEGKLEENLNIWDKLLEVDDEIKFYE